MSEYRRSVTIDNPLPIKRADGGGVMVFWVFKAETFNWYSGDRFSLLIGGREMPVPENWIGIGHVTPPDPQRDLHSVRLTDETACLSDGDQLIVIFQDPRHTTGAVKEARRTARIAAHALDALGRVDEAAVLREKYEITDETDNHC
jgi:hypothetical protein